MSAITLENEFLRVSIHPDQGTGILAFYVHQNGSWLPVMPDTREEGSRLNSASFLMVPYSNRIQNGAFAFQGKSYQLAYGERHAIHGDVHSRPWIVEEATAERLRCTFHSADHESVNWPWPFESRAEYSLDGTVFSSRLTLWNRGQSAMPAGFGWHPFLNRTLTRPGEPVRLCMRVVSVYPDANGNRIPSGPAQPLLAEQDFSTERTLDPDYFLDSCFQGYDGDGYILWPESRVKLSYACSPQCTHLVIYNPLQSPIFAVEPVTNANNGVNLHARGWPGSGIVVLSPGECLEARFDLRVSTGGM